MFDDVYKLLLWRPLDIITITVTEGSYNNSLCYYDILRI